jgi:hypothetical protein
MSAFYTFQKETHLTDMTGDEGVRRQSLYFHQGFCSTNAVPNWNNDRDFAVAVRYAEIYGPMSE